MPRKEYVIVPTWTPPKTEFGLAKRKEELDAHKRPKEAIEPAAKNWRREGLLLFFMFL